MSRESANDRNTLRELAKRYLDICSDPVQDERRALWRAHNSLKSTRRLIYVRAFAWPEMEASACVCEDPLFRAIENKLRHDLFWNAFNDDSIFEPWVTVPAVHAVQGWGVGVPRRHSEEPGGSFKVGYPIKQLDDIDNLRRIPNLRRIAVSPFADVARCAGQIGTDYVISYRPSPADMVSYGFDPDRIRSILRRDLEPCRGLHVDITLKDVQTVQHDPTRVRDWVALTRTVIGE